MSDSLIPSLGALPHSFQFLYFVQNKARSVLTVNGTGSELWEKSHEILYRLNAEKPRAEDLYSNNASYRNRIIWLSHNILSKRNEKNKVSRPIRALRYALIVFVLGFFGVKFWESYQYNDVYEIRIEEQIKKLEEKKKQKQEMAYQGK